MCFLTDQQESTTSLRRISVPVLLICLSAFMTLYKRAFLRRMPAAFTSISLRSVCCEPLLWWWSSCLAGYIMFAAWIASSILCMHIQYKYTSKSTEIRYVPVPVCSAVASLLSQHRLPMRCDHQVSLVHSRASFVWEHNRDDYALSSTSSPMPVSWATWLMMVDVSSRSSVNLLTVMPIAMSVSGSYSAAEPPMPRWPTSVFRSVPSKPVNLYT